MSEEPLYHSDIPGIPMKRGKVRDVYELGDRLLIIATDRLSAFDVIFPDPIPMKGKVLTQLSLWWFRKTKGIIDNHLITDDLELYPEELQPYRDQLRGRSMIVKNTQPLKAEFVVRGYLDGSAYEAYQCSHHLSGIPMLAGLKRHSSFGGAFFTPSTKADEGHDRTIEFEELCCIIGRDLARKGRRVANDVYVYAHNFLYDRGLVLSDTKFEFGIDEKGELILIDEMLTPDSSRYWLKETYHPDSEKAVSLDKQYVRDYVAQIGWDKEPPAPKLPSEVIQQTTERYLKAFEMITGSPLAE